MSLRTNRRFPLTIKCLICTDWSPIVLKVQLFLRTKHLHKVLHFLFLKRNSLEVIYLTKPFFFGNKESDEGSSKKDRKEGEKEEESKRWREY